MSILNPLSWFRKKEEEKEEVKEEMTLLGLIDFLLSGFYDIKRDLIKYSEDNQKENILFAASRFKYLVKPMTNILLKVNELKKEEKKTWKKEQLSKLSGYAFDAGIAFKQAKKDFNNKEYDKTQTSLALSSKKLTQLKIFLKDNE